MESVILYPISYSKVKSVLFDLIALVAIYLVPAISHVVGFPVYYLEPMRIMLVLAIVHTSRKNAYLIALTLPLFSLLISTHPSLVKSSLITLELLLNVWLFFFLSEKLSNKMLSMFISIILSTIFYYILKLIMINTALLSGNLISTPLYIQIIMLIFFSGYVYLVNFSKREKN